MACCILIAALLGAALAPVFHGGGAELDWRPGDAPRRKANGVEGGMFDWRARARSLRHAADGLAFVVANEPNARLHLIAAAAAIAMGHALGFGLEQWRWIALAIALVFAGEATNSAIEHLCDVVSPQKREAVRRAKDVAAGAVLILALAALLLGVMTASQAPALSLDPVALDDVALAALDAICAAAPQS